MGTTMNKIHKTLLVGCIAVAAAGCGSSRGSAGDKDPTTTTTVKSTTTTEVDPFDPSNMEWAVSTMLMTEEISGYYDRLSDAANDEDIITLMAVCDEGYADSTEWIETAAAITLDDVRTPMVLAVNEYQTMFKYCGEGDLEKSLPYLKRADRHAQQAAKALERYT